VMRNECLPVVGECKLLIVFSSSARRTLRVGR
jgi:hypothetical protein